MERIECSSARASLTFFQDGAELLKKPAGAPKGLLGAFGRQHPLQDCGPVFETLLTLPVVRMEEEK